MARFRHGSGLAKDVMRILIETAEDGIEIPGETAVAPDTRMRVVILPVRSRFTR